MSVAEIQTRGKGGSLPWWVKSFKLQVQKNEYVSYFTWAESESKVYPANSDNDSIVTIKLPSPIKCKAIRIIPWEWNDSISMRCDISIVA